MVLLPEWAHQAEVQEKASKAAQAVNDLHAEMDKLCQDYPGLCGKNTQSSNQESQTDDDYGFKLPSQEKFNDLFKP